jgi:hypothetical protein
VPISRDGASEEGRRNWVGPFACAAWIESVNEANALSGGGPTSSSAASRAGSESAGSNH